MSGRINGISQVNRVNDLQQVSGVNEASGIMLKRNGGMEREMRTQSQVIKGSRSFQDDRGTFMAGNLHIPDKMYFSQMQGDFGDSGFSKVKGQKVNNKKEMGYQAAEEGFDLILGALG